MIKPNIFPVNYEKHLDTHLEQKNLNLMVGIKCEMSRFEINWRGKIPFSKIDGLWKMRQIISKSNWTFYEVDERVAYLM